VTEGRASQGFRLSHALSAVLFVFGAVGASAVDIAPVETCQVVAAADEPKNPYKKPDGTYDQGMSGSCVFTSLVNSNIKAGADDKDGKFMRKFRLCLARKGYGNLWRRGVPADANGDPTGPAYEAMLECKREARAANTVSGTLSAIVGADVMFKTIKSTEPWKTRKQALVDALSTTPSGAAVIGTMSPKGLHSSSVLSVDCTAKTIKILDPNGTEHTLTFDDTGKITQVDPPNNIYKDGKITYVTVEMQNP
jgi:hypothetical protein